MLTRSSVSWFICLWFAQIAEPPSFTRAGQGRKAFNVAFPRLCRLLARLPSGSDSPLTQRRDTHARYSYVGKWLADLPCGARIKKKWWNTMETISERKA